MHISFQSTKWSYFRIKRIFVVFMSKNNLTFFELQLFKLSPPSMWPQTSSWPTFWAIRIQHVLPNDTAIVDTVIVLDGSGSVSRCDFSKAKEALKHLMDTLNQPRYDSKYAAVTFSSTATVNFKFLPYSSSASQITTIPYPGEMTNTQAGLKEAKKLFDDPFSGTSSRIMFLVFSRFLGLYKSKRIL